MCRSNVDKIYVEHPFLENICPRVGIKSAKVKRWSEAFFKLSPVTWYDARYTYKFFLLDSKGEVVSRVGESWVPLWTSDENAGQALARIGEKEKGIKYAVYLGNASSLVLFKR